MSGSRMPSRRISSTVGMIASDFEFTKLPADERWLWREARLLDPSGNVICLYRAGDNRKNPPWRIA